MSGRINLNAGMRSNLLALQNIQRNMNVVQNRLATGLKINSAIDNPSSYYTAKSLNARASDLSALLDSMGQGIQNIMAANEGLKAATQLLEQAKTIANQTASNMANYIAVSTAEELIAAVNAGDELIVLNNDITLDNDTTLNLKNGQKIVGQSYLNGGAKSVLTFNNTTSKATAINLTDNNSLVDIKIEYNGGIADSFAITNAAKNDVTLHNVEIVTRGSGILNDGKITYSGSLDITANSIMATRGIENGASAENIFNAKVNIVTNAGWSFGILEGNNIFNNDLKITNNSGISSCIRNGNNTFNGKTDFIANYDTVNYAIKSNSIINLNNSSQTLFDFMSNNREVSGTDAVTNWQRGAMVGLKRDGAVHWYRAVADGSVTGKIASHITTSADWVEIASPDTPYPANATVVTNETELLAAVANNDATIIVDGNITMSENASIKLNENQQLVGKNYFTGDGSVSALNFTTTTEGIGSIEVNNNVLLSDLEINLTCTADDTANETYAVFGIDYSDIKFNNLDINVVATKDCRTYGMVNTDCTSTYTGNINVNINATKSNGIVIYGGLANFNGNISSSGASNVAVMGGVNLTGSLTASSKGTGLGRDLILRTDSRTVVEAPTILMQYSDNSWESGAYFGIRNGNVTTWYKSTAAGSYDGDDVNAMLAGWERVDEPPAKAVVTESYSKFTFSNEAPNVLVKQGMSASDASKLFNNVLLQYDYVVADSTYNGVNLLQKENLTLHFDNDQNNFLLLEGVDAGRANLNLNDADWKTSGAVANSVNEIEAAIDTLRSFASEFGNYYAIIKTRQEFTESLINVLTSGADNLTLADMNEESANMLSLQTAQQLAINSLSLAAQSSQSVLKLFV